MAVSILKRPRGFILENFISGTVTSIQDTISGALFVINSHGLFDGDVIYCKSPIENYNGFFYVDKFNDDSFLLSEYESAPFVGGPYIPFIKNSEVSYYYSPSDHEWNCIHLPIIYELSNTLWPVNSADTVRIISSVTDSNGYCALSLSGDIKATGSAAVLDSVIVSNANDSSYNGVYQIRAYTNDTTFVIDLAYSLLGSDAALSGASIQFYYNNYVVKVQVWGGLNSGHEYYAQKPYELLGTLDLIPDETGITKFSVSDLLKEHIKNSNNLLLGTLPNNLDAWTGFFIKYGEEYDTSDGTVLSRSTVTYTSDLSNFQGKAVNAILPFKNLYSGALSEFSSENSSQKFLTNFIRPTIFSGQYFDLGILWDGIQTIFLKSEWYLNNVLQDTDYGSALDAFYTGVYREQIEANCNYDRVDVTAYKTTGIPAPSTWGDSSFASAYDFKTATQLIEIVGLGTGQQAAYTAMSASNGDVVIVDLIVEVSGVWTGTLLSLSAILTNSADTGVNSTASPDITANGTYNFRLEVPVTVSSPVVERLHIVFTSLNILTGGPAISITVNNYVSVVSSNNIISETKTIDIDCECIQSKATGYNLQWLNNLGHFDSWYFKAYADQIIDIVETEETETNLFEDWPNSYGEFSDTVNKETSRRSRQQFLCRSEGLTLDQMNAIKFIKSSPLVQIVNSIYDRTTVILDSDSFTAYKEGQQEQYTISFICTYTNDIPSQPG